MSMSTNWNIAICLRYWYLTFVQNKIFWQKSKQTTDSINAKLENTLGFIGYKNYWPAFKDSIENERFVNGIGSGKFALDSLWKKKTKIKPINLFF